MTTHLTPDEADHLARLVQTALVPIAATPEDVVSTITPFINTLLDDRKDRLLEAVSSEFSAQRSQVLSAIDQAHRILISAVNPDPDPAHDDT